ncbi:unnamed protein product [Urochloa decumbens]|uniref:Uncharacterized protein n=1 Tax=Urochloa decumbens TaxID=240449 RepID=A0ABC9CSN6_9POAL
MSRAEVAIRRAGAAVTLAAACALMRIPAPEAHEHVVLALHAAFLLGAAAVQLAPAHRTVAALVRRAAAQAADGMALGASTAGLLRWVGFAGGLFYALYVAGGDVRAEASSVDKVKDLLLFLVFLAAVWAVYLSMVTGRGCAPQPRPAAPAAVEEEEELDGGEEVDAMAPRPARVLVD